MTDIYNGELRIGLDVGSTTVKVAAVDGRGDAVYRQYQRHHSDIKKTIKDALSAVCARFRGGEAAIAITGSGGILVSEWLGLPFVQEVIAGAKAVERYIPQTDVAIELGGEDAKITYFTNGVEQRMNGTCAGGTGAFVDQMATLMKTDAKGLDELAAGAGSIYPIASRCGVFAKSDIQPLLNEGAARADIAASVFQSIVNQTISGLACGRPIKGNVAFLGGPLHFLPRLRERFAITLGLSPEQTLIPEHAELFVAIGAACAASGRFFIDDIAERSKRLDVAEATEVKRLAPLFASDGELRSFRQRHAGCAAKRKPLSEHVGDAYLGIDAGSTTTKAVLTDADGAILFSWYKSNGGNPLASTVQLLKAMYAEMPKTARLARCCVTGYGEQLVRAALFADYGEIETIAHYKAAKRFLPDVEFILDIGGQDMKCMRVKDGVIDSVMLNEACSSGCGSFIEAFAESLGTPIDEFVRIAIESKNPVDLGSRCTVFMNSRVKQAQKEGATAGDISAGLSYSVVKNALYKVIKLRNPDDMGKSAIVQGGTFLNDSVLRAFEIISGKNAVRPDIAGLMGAFGAAIVAKEKRAVFAAKAPQDASSLLSKENLESFRCETSTRRCGLCGNNCLLTVNDFGNGRSFIAGNRCERGAGIDRKDNAAPNLFAEKYARTFSYYRSRDLADAPRGEVGIPRALNMYENYPFWHTFFTKLGFRVTLSPRSTKSVYEMGIESMPSESACYPAKLTHGHVRALIDRGVKYIFHPCVTHEKREDGCADNCFNCPVVTSYPEVIKNNMEEIAASGVRYHMPFLPLGSPKRMKERCYEEMAFCGASRSEIDAAVDAAYDEAARFKADIRDMGARALKWIEANGGAGVVLAGRPYHTDPEINHGIPEMAAGLGLAVLTEDSIAHLDPVARPLRVVDQWAYHTRLYSAANVVRGRDDLELIQLNSFGCGLDAVTTDQVQEILHSAGKLYTALKIDETNNLGAARIRVRSLKSAIEDRAGRRAAAPTAEYAFRKVEFTPQMRVKHTILAPQMAPIHFRFLEAAFRASGYNLVILPSKGQSDAETGLKYVNNDACYPSIIVVGQIISALMSGEYDLSSVSVIITQTGGGCRATNYIGFIRKALVDAGLAHVPVIALSAAGLENNRGFRLSLGLFRSAMLAIMYGDLFLQLTLRTRPYETSPGEADRLLESWAPACLDNVKDRRLRIFNRNAARIIEDFERIPLADEKKPRVGLVGEILVKFHPGANNDVVGLVESEGAEAVMPGLMGFLLYTAYNAVFRHKKLDGSLRARVLSELLIFVVERYGAKVNRLLKKSSRFEPSHTIRELAAGASETLSLGNATGEGWLLTAEMLQLIKSGAHNIICMQPFACLPNHVTGKGMIKALKTRFPIANIVAVDYDPGASEVNQLNRVKLMLSVAFRASAP